MARAQAVRRWCDAASFGAALWRRLDAVNTTKLRAADGCAWEVGWRMAALPVRG